MYYHLYSIVKHDSDIKGYWKDKQGKIYIDSINIIPYHSKKSFKIAKKALFASGELSIFYRIGRKAIIEDNKKNITILNKRLEFIENKNFQVYNKIKDIIKQYNGCTVYHKKGHILIEVFTN